MKIITKKTMYDVNISKDICLLRVDLDVGYSNNDAIKKYKLKWATDSIKETLKLCKKIIVLSNYGKLSDEEIKNIINSMNIKYRYISECIGTYVTECAKNIVDEEVLFLGNIDNLPNNKDKSYSEFWASICDVFIFDAPNLVTGKSISCYGIAKYANSTILGYLLTKEAKVLKELEVVENKCFFCGWKSLEEEKKIFIKYYMNNFNNVFFTGVISLEIYKNNNNNIGKSAFDPIDLKNCKEIFSIWENKILLPVDYSIVKFLGDENIKNIDIEKINDTDICVDIGTKTIENIKKIKNNYNLFVISGTSGIVEIEKYAFGTIEILKMFKNFKKTIISNELLIDFLFSHNFTENDFYHISYSMSKFDNLITNHNINIIDIVDDK